MKKALSLILALVMCLSLCACGGSTDAPVTEAPTTAATEAPTTAATEATEPIITTLTLGETATTEVISYTLNSVEFVDRLSLSAGENYFAPIAEYELGNLVPNNGKIFVCFSFTVKNIGKVELDTFAYSEMKLTYSDGYEFTINAYNNIVRTDDKYYVNQKLNGPLNLQVLSDAQTYRGYIEVPAEVMNNTEAPFALVVALQKGPETAGYITDLYTEYTFSLRP